MQAYPDQHEGAVKQLGELARLSGLYSKWIKSETKMTKQEFAVHSVGKVNPKKRLEGEVEHMLNNNVMNCLGSMVNGVVF